MSSFNHIKEKHDCTKKKRMKRDIHTKKNPIMQHRFPEQCLEGLQRSLQLFTDKDKACSLEEYKCTQVIVRAEVVPPLDNCSNSVQWCVLSLVLQGSVGYLNLGLTFSMTEYDALNAGCSAELLLERGLYKSHVSNMNMKVSSFMYRSVNTVY